MPSGPPKRPTPPPLAPVPKQRGYLVEDDEEKTPVTNDPFVALDHRSKRTHEDTKSALHTIQLVATHVENLDERITRKVSDLDRKLDQYITNDQKEHASLRSAQEKSAGGIRTVSAQVAAMDKQQAVNSKVLELIHDDVRAIKRVEEHRTKVTIETDAVVRQATVNDAADSASTRRKRGLEIVKIIGTALGSGGIITIIVVALLGKC